MNRRTIVYVDGFNLYYGAVKDTPYRWLNLEELFRRLLGAENLVRIYYFTSLVRSAGARRRQQTLLDAFSACPLISVRYGLFHRSGPEKMTDVAIAVRMLDDAYRDAADRFVLVTADTDQTPAVRKLKERFPQKEVRVYLPVGEPDGRHPTARPDFVRTKAKSLREAADRVESLPWGLIRACQLPETVRLPDGRTVSRPPEWR